MSDYIKTTDFGPKDVLASGDPNKKVRGSELDTEFDNIETAISTKYDSNDLGTVLQAYDADLSAIAALTSAANKMPYSTGAQAWALTDLSAFARTILDDADAAAVKTTLGLTIGSDVQAYDASLTSLAALATAGDKAPYTTAANTYAEMDVTSFARTLLDDADAATARTTLGVSDAIHTTAYGGGFSTTSATLSNVTGAVIAVTNTYKYLFEFFGDYDCDVASVGLSLAVTAPSGTLRYSVNIHGFAADGAGEMFSGDANASAGTVTATASVDAASHTFHVVGYFIASASGNLQLQAAVETATGSPTLSIDNVMCVATKVG